MKRRELIALLGGAVAAWPLATGAQVPQKTARIGYIGSNRDNPVFVAGSRAFLDELRRSGFVEGHNLLVEHRSTEQDIQAVFTAASELIRLNVDVLIAGGPEIALQAALRASRTIPIVIMATNYDPLARGYVQSLSKPGGNVTGVFVRQIELAEKQVELLSEALPGRTRLAILWDRLSIDQFTSAEKRADALGIDVRSTKLENPPYDYAAAFEAMAQGGAQMLLVASSPFFTAARLRLAELAIQYRLPTMFIFKSYVEAGGLLSYSSHIENTYRRLGAQTAMVLNGEDPANIPIEQPTTYELVINLKTARALGIELPSSLLARADEVIE
jgi:putative ABC transport system substrate-binding protein